MITSTMVLDTTKMVVPSNSALIKGMGVISDTAKVFRVTINFQAGVLKLVGATLWPSKSTV